MADAAVAAPQAPQQGGLPPAIEYRQLMGECQQLMQKIAELEVDRNEHALVEETLIPLDPSRRAYRLVGEVLVERSVAEVLPSVKANKEGVRRQQKTNARHITSLFSFLTHNSLSLSVSSTTFLFLFVYFIVATLNIMRYL